MKLLIPRRWTRRLALPFLTLCLVCICAAAGLTWQQEQQAAVGSAIRETRGRVGDLRQTLKDLRQRAEYMGAFRGIYETARERGVLAAQERLKAGDAIERLAVEHGLRRVKYTFEQARRVPLARDGAANDGDTRDRLVGTKLRLNVDARREAAIFAFLDDIRERLRGYVVLRSLEVTREVRTLDNVLTAIRNGEHPTVVRGVAEMAWVTLSLDETSRPEKETPDA